MAFQPAAGGVRTPPASVDGSLSASSRDVFPALARFAAGEPSPAGPSGGCLAPEPPAQAPELQPRAAPPPCRGTLPVSRLQGPRALPTLRHPTLAPGSCRSRRWSRVDRVSAHGRGCLDTTSFRGRPSERLLARCFPAPARFAAGEPSQPGQAEGVWPLSRLPRLWNLQPRAAPPPCRDTLPVSRLQGPRAVPPLPHPTLAQGAGSCRSHRWSRFDRVQPAAGGVWIPLPSVDGPLSASSRDVFPRRPDSLPESPPSRAKRRVSGP